MKTKMKMYSLLISCILLVLLAVLMIGLVSAFNFDNVKRYDTNKKEITITNAYGLGSDLAKYTLTDNSNLCNVECYAEGTVVIYSSNVLFEGIEFNTLKGSKELLSYKYFTEEDGEYIKEVPVEQENRKAGNKWITLKGLHWEEYKGEELETGTYRWRIEAIKTHPIAIDWIATSYGLKFSEWLLWNYGFDMYTTNDDDQSGFSSTKYDAEVFNASATYTPTQIAIKAWDDGGTGTAYVNITTVNGSGAPTDAGFYTGSIDSTTFGASPGIWKNITLSGSGLIYNNTKYAIVVYGGAGVDAKWRLDVTSPSYTRGTYWGRNEPGTWSEDAASDAMFVMYGNEEAIYGTAGYNSTTYETATESYIFNYTYSSVKLNSATLSYAGTNYSTILSNNISTKQLTPTTQATNTFYWTLSLTNATATYDFKTPSLTQTVNPIIFGICNDTNTNAIVNITFKDESSGEDLNGTATNFYFTYGLGSSTKTLFYINSTDNPNYLFCFTPNLSVTLSATLSYAGTGYPTRNSNIASQVIYSSLVTKVLYLLSASGSHIYTTFITATQTNSPIQGVSVTVEKQISGIWTTLEQTTSDAAGSVTFWLDQSTSYRITANKTGYASSQFSITPSQSIYTILMETSSGNITYTSDIEGINWLIGPNQGLISEGVHTFYFNLTANKGNVVGCKMELVNNNSVAVSTTTGCSSFGGNLSADFDTTGYKVITGRYSINIGGGYFVVDADAYWFLMPLNKSGTTLVDFFTDLKNTDLGLFGEDTGHREYTMIVLTFLIIVITCASLSYAGWDMATQGGILLLLLPLIWIASTAGFLALEYPKPLTPFTLVNQYFIALIVTLYALGYAVRRLT